MTRRIGQGTQRLEALSLGALNLGFMVRMGQVDFLVGWPGTPLNAIFPLNIFLPNYCP